MISPERKTIEDIFTSSTYRFSVPDYQRNFDWGKNELQELIDDLKDVKESEKRQLFLGNFIFDVAENENTKIVDGQQRLTTISIILIAIREHAKKINESEFAGEIHSKVSISASYRKEQGNRVSVSQNIKEIFEYISRSDWREDFPDQINSQSIKRQVNKVKPIYNYVINELSGYSISDLQEFMRALMDSYVIVIQVENTEDVFSIFERTNARGLDLNIGDLLKNYIFSHGVEEYEAKWNEIIINAESSLQRMLKYFWISRNGHVQQSQLYRKLKKYGNEKGIQDFVDELYSFSRYYKVTQSMEDAEVKSWLEEIELHTLANNEDYYERINRVFQALKLFRVTQGYPLIYALFIFYKKAPGNNYKKLLEVLEAIERYHFVNNVVAGKIGNEVEKFYADYSRYFYESGDNFGQEIDHFIQELRKKKALKEDFESNFVESIVYDQKNIEMINYVFDRINNHDTKGGQRVPVFSPDKSLSKRNYNIEHILPQSRKSEFDEKESEFFDMIGNLLVIPSHSNSEFQHKSPHEKAEMIKNDTKYSGNLRYINDFIKENDGKFENWDFEDIETRSRSLAQESYETYWQF